MSLLFRALGAIEMLIVAVTGAGKVLSTLMESGFLDAIGMLFLVTVSLVLSMPLYLLGSLMDDVEALRRQIAELKETNKETDKNEHRHNLLYIGGWKCSCGRVNDDYASTCACGKDRYVIDKAYNPTSRAVEPDQSVQVVAGGWKKQEQDVLNAGGWKCSCGRVNAGYVSTCACGKSKHEVEQ